MKVAIITVGQLPVPVTKGGAVETLIQHIIDKNESAKQIHLTVFSIYENNAYNKSLKFNNTKFEFIHVNVIKKRYYEIYARIMNKVFNATKCLRGAYLSQIIKKIQNENYDSIVIENDPTFAYELSKVVKNTKIYVHLHNDFINEKTKNIEKLSKKIDYIITVSDYIKNRVLESKYFDESNVIVLKNCVDVDRFNKELYLDIRDIIRERYKISHNDIVIMYSGRLSPEKGIEPLIKAFLQFKNNSNIKLLLVGSAWFSDNNDTEFVKRIREISEKNKGNIIFTGFINPNELPEIYSIADINVVPSLWEEPAGLVLLEAMATSSPLITTNVGGIPEYVNGDCSILIDRDENIVESLRMAIEKLVLDKGLRQNMGREGRKNVAQYSIEMYYNNFLRIIKKVESKISK
ncbi:glycosyltransferase family 4 protein [Bacillus sp. MRMR6]|uniref:glycosyltransferase family 4 protein n=1 Tax=Bacillus sp. MRMR6 TaxID=1928617 RepID=UPI0009521381|nr:glycosyltransferase family 4 protein [Bacillus sp. MRMR6]OLS41092.1 hypothetical protein BTR25_04285 [Bacillus sp. MRMR6]